MKDYRYVITFLAILVTGLLAACGGGAKVRQAQIKPPAPPVITPETMVHLVNTDYDRLSSRVLIRRIKVPTRANLDFAAYAENIVIYDTLSPVTKPPAEEKTLPDLHFNNVLVSKSIVNSIDSLPFSAAEKGAPLHWAALKEYLVNWDFEKAQSIMEAAAKVSDEKWGNDDIYQSLQDLSYLYLHKTTAGYQLWAKVEFKPWAAVFGFVTDENNDKFPEFYAQIDPKHLNVDLLDHIVNDYAKKVLDAEGVETWANELASFWYPSYNTDIAADELKAIWPNEVTDADAKKSLGDLTVKDPMVVIKGKPFNYAIYNVFLVDGMKPKEEEAAAVAGTDSSTPSPSGIDPSVPGAIKECLATLAAEQKKYCPEGYEKWAARYKPFYDHLQGELKKLPQEVSGVEGKDGYIFFNRSFEYLCGGDITKQAEGKNPFAIIVAFKDLLAKQGIDFLFIPIPVKPAIYADKAGGPLPEKGGPITDPFSRKFLKDLLEAGVEVVDLWPVFRAERDRTKAGEPPLYQKQDTHWTARGLELAAKVIGERIKKYTWYKDMKTSAFTTKKATFTRQGDIVTRLNKAVQAKYKPAELTGHQVMLADGQTLYKDKKGSPILVLGDSFTAVFQRTDCKHAGLTAHIAREIGFPTRLIMGFGGGPTVVKKLEKKGKPELAGKKLVIWVMVSRDLYNYWEDWKMPEGLD